MFIFILCLSVFYLLYATFTQPITQRIQHIQKTAAQQKTALAQEQAVITQGQKMPHKKLNPNTLIAKLTPIPLSHIIAELTQLSQNKNITLEAIQPLTATTESHITIQPIKLVIQGQYLSLLDFLQNLTTLHFLILLQEIQLTLSDAAGSPMIEANCVFNVYAQEASSCWREINM